MANKHDKINPALLDELLKGQDPQTVFSSTGLLGDLKKALAERILDAEMDVHLGSDDEQMYVRGLRQPLPGSFVP